ncbi:DUF262 domain-containing protein [Streptomyces griseiscabiei]|uniref:DUF262 domain-containing protein n=1 Tax=Streptomyces griseiscabiei TaxID=2993540 RepID=A0ABU4L8N0_9ACTN|nr:DUF262 domain-containing protein [Streptomyces griseiscabiei]MBZ3905053.1 DUF262 domain-containing protein [Streptomyces griseiscabiei]MDX2912028.1 DUF262 domain-containing protein [Streptomyces griseiscabiei]
MSTAGLETQPSATTYELGDLVAQAWNGKVHVPHFQRDFRWGTTDVLRLFDSIVKGYPIGNLLLWVRKTPARSFTLGSLQIDAPAAQEAFWVVDGQQRITSLANALSPEGHLHEPFSVYYDLAEKKFIAQPKTREPQHIALPVLFDLKKLLGWFRTEGELVAELFDEADSVATALRQYKVPAYLVRQDDLDVLTDIFDRMNNYGKRLNRAEIFSALYAGPEEGAAERLNLSRIADRIATRTGFGTVDTDTVLASILARRGPDPSRDIRNEFTSVGRRTAPEFKDEDQYAAYGEGEESLVRAIGFLQAEAQVPHISLLVYRALLVVMTRFFAHFPDPQPNSRRLLRRLYWRVAVSGPAVFKGSFTQVSRVLCARIRKGDEHGSIMGLMDAMAEAQPSMPTIERFRTNEAAAKIILSSWWSLRPRSLVTGAPFDVQDLSTLLADQKTAGTVAHVIFPHGLTSQQVLYAANRLFLPSAEDPVSEITTLLAHRPSHLEEDSWDKILTSHVMDRRTSQALAAGNREEFLRLRQENIQRHLSEFLSRMAEWAYEDTPSLDSLDFDELDELNEREELF